MLSTGYNGSTWCYLYIGTRLASHGFVVAITDHDRDGQYHWSYSDDIIVTLFNRTRDVSFAITELLQKNATVGESLYGVMDPSKIAMSGHSLGGYATLALAGGDDDVCDPSSVLANYSAHQFACVPSPPDPRIKAIVTLDPSSWGMRYGEMARISVPNLIIGETVDHNLSYNPGQIPENARDNARPHAAINRNDSYRVDVTMANHISLTNACDGPQVMSSVGVDASTLLGIYGSVLNPSAYPCGTYGGFDPTTNPATRQIVTTYMLAFLNTYLGREDDSWMLTSSYARQQQPLVEFFDSEACNECSVGDGEYSYRPHPCQCSVGKKDPVEYF
jgi:predicted dienelactone hydrolase